MATLGNKHAYEYILVRKEPEVVEGWRPKKSESAIHTVLFAYKFPKGWLTKKAKAERAALPGVTCIFEPNVSMLTIEKWTPKYSEPRGCYSLRGEVNGDDCVVSVRGWAEEFFDGLQWLEKDGVRVILASTLVHGERLKGALQIMARKGRFPFLTDERISTISYPSYNSSHKCSSITLADPSDFLAFALYGLSDTDAKDLLKKRVIILGACPSRYTKLCGELVLPTWTNGSKSTVCAMKGNTMASRYLLVISKFLQLSVKDRRYHPALPPVWTALEWAVLSGLVGVPLQTADLWKPVWRGAASDFAKPGGHTRNIKPLMDFYVTKTVFDESSIKRLMDIVSEMVSEGT